MDKHVTVEFFRRSWKVDANRARFGLMILLPAYALVTAWAVVLVILATPLDGARHLATLAELQGDAALRDSALSSSFALRSNGLSISLTGLIALPFAAVFWLGMLTSLRIVSRNGNVDALRECKTLKWMAALVLFTIPLAALMGFALVAQLSALSFGLGYLVYLAMAAICILLCLSRLLKLSQYLERRVSQPASPAHPPAQLSRMLKILFGVFIALALVLPASWPISPGSIFRLEYIYAPMLALFMAVSIGWWRGPLNLWRRRNRLVIFAASSFIAAAIGIGAFEVYNFTTFNTVEYLQALEYTDEDLVIWGFLGPLFFLLLLLVALSPLLLGLSPLLLALLPLVLGLSIIHARLRSERDA